jgi:hypothetical protein
MLVKLGSFGDALFLYRNMHHKKLMVFSMGKFPFYSFVNGPEVLHLLPKELCLCEVIHSDSGRLFMDLDADVERWISHIEICVKEYMLVRYDTEVRLSWKWSHGKEKRWHCVISGMYIEGNWRKHSMDFADYMLHKMPSLEIDRGVYRHKASLRMVGQCKYVSGLYCRELRPYRNTKLSDLLISQPFDDKILDEHVSHIQHELCPEMHMEENLRFPQILGYKIPRKVFSDASKELYRLDRKCPSECLICDRIHHSENAYLIRDSMSVRLICFRSPGIAMRWDFLPRTNLPT